MFLQTLISNDTHYKTFQGTQTQQCSMCSREPSEDLNVDSLVRAQMINDLLSQRTLLPYLYWKRFKLFLIHTLTLWLWMCCEADLILWPCLRSDSWQEEPELKTVLSHKFLFFTALQGVMSSGAARGHSQGFRVAFSFSSLMLCWEVQKQ